MTNEHDAIVSLGKTVRLPGRDYSAGSSRAGAGGLNAGRPSQTIELRSRSTLAMAEGNWR
jgi:hypothetical protein